MLYVSNIQEDGKIAVSNSNDSLTSCITVVEVEAISRLVFGLCENDNVFM